MVGPLAGGTLQGCVNYSTISRNSANTGTLTAPLCHTDLPPQFFEAALQHPEGGSDAVLHRDHVPGGEVAVQGKTEPPLASASGGWGTAKCLTLWVITEIAGGFNDKPLSARRWVQSRKGPHHFCRRTALLVVGPLAGTPPFLPKIRAVDGGTPCGDPTISAEDPRC